MIPAAFPHLRLLPAGRGPSVDLLRNVVDRRRWAPSPTPEVSSHECGSREIIPLATIAAAGISLLIEFGVLAAAIPLVTGQLMLHLIPVLARASSRCQAMFSAGLAFWLSACNVRFRDVEYLTGVALLAYFYMTPILYSPDLIPDTEVFNTGITVQQLALANPMARFAMAYRNVFYDIRLPGLNTILWLVGWSVVLFFLGFRFYVRRSDYFAESM